MPKPKVKDMSGFLVSWILNKAYDRVKPYYGNGMEWQRCARALDQLKTPYFWEKQNKHTTTFTSCTCQDYRIRKIDCKHIWSLKILAEYSRIIAERMNDAVLAEFRRESKLCKQ